jgi:hypothetical protein
LCLSQIPISSTHHGLPPSHQLSPPTPTTTEFLPPPRLTFSKLKLSYIIYTYTANKPKKERKKELSKNKKRKKERVTVGSVVEWTANDEEKMAVVESRRCE